MSKKLHRISFKESVNKIDEANGVIYGVSVITANREALGHEMYIDETTIEQVVSKGKEYGDLGLKARFDHPNACGGSMGTQVGRFKNFRVEGMKAVADLHLYESAANTPNGDYRSYILSMAKEDPNAFATSIVFKAAEPFLLDKKELKKLDENDPKRFPHARVDELYACDVVDEAAANDSLFGRPDYLAEQAEKWMNEKKDLMFSLLDKYFKRNKMKELEELKAENDNQALAQMEADLKNLIEENKSLKEKSESFEKEIQKVKEEFANDLKIANEKIKELESLRIGSPIVTAPTTEVVEVVEVTEPKKLTEAQLAAKYMAEEIKHQEEKLKQNLKK